MAKREARIERKAARALALREKSARLRERQEFVQEVRLGADPSSIFQMKMTWTCDAPDNEGHWQSGTPRKWEDDHWQDAIEPKLDQWRQLTWAEIDALSSGTGHKMHHNMDVEVITEEAQIRLLDLEKITDTIFRFRLGGKPRLWGFRVVGNFEVLWFDPEHEIYPVEPH